MTTSSQKTSQKRQKRYETATSLLRLYQPGVEEPAATAEQLIDLYTGGISMSAKAGKRLSSPIYSALSDMAKEGLVAEEEEFNEDTQHMNTRYRLVAVQLPPKPVQDTYKSKFLASQERVKKLEEENKILEELATEAGRRYAEVLAKLPSST